MNIEQEIAEIKQRNRKVEIDKAWERSAFRRVFLMALTFAAAFCFFFASGVTQDIRTMIISALVPSTAYLISTFALPVLRKYWEKQR